MTLDALIRGAPKAQSVGSATAIPATAATEEGGKAGKVARVATIAVADPGNAKTEGTEAAIGSEAARAPSPHPTLPRLPPISEGRRQRVLAILARDGGQYAVAVDTPWRRADPVILVLATPDGTCELRLPRDRFDLPAVMKMVDGWNTADPRGERCEGEEVRPGDHPLLVKPETEQRFRAWYWQSNRYDPKGRCGGTYLAPASDDMNTVKAYLEKTFGVQITGNCGVRVTHQLSTAHDNF